VEKQGGFTDAEAVNNTAIPHIQNLFGVSSEFLGQLRTWLEQNPPTLSVNSLLGYTNTVPQFANVALEAHTTSSTYADPSVSGGAGPTIDNLPDGKYVIQFGGSGGGDFAHNVTYHMGISVNGSTPTDDLSAEFASDRGNTSGMMVNLATLSAGGNNTIKAVYRSSDGTDRGNIRYRWIMAIRQSN
jgi:hypothetical protein